jgi:hypothetical protein
MSLKLHFDRITKYCLVIFPPNSRLYYILPHWMGSVDSVDSNAITGILFGAGAQ